MSHDAPEGSIEEHDRSSSPKEEVEKAKYLANYRRLDPSFQSDRPQIQAVADRSE